MYVLLLLQTGGGEVLDIRQQKASPILLGNTTRVDNNGVESVGRLSLPEATMGRDIKPGIRRSRTTLIPLCTE